MNLIIGGTGTLGTELISRLTKEGQKVAVLSRDELKQYRTRQAFPGVKTILGDIRDPGTVLSAMEGVETVFHVAALKQIDTVEENPVEAIKTNVIGTVNVAESCVKAGVRFCVFSSTDKAVLPINTYGMTKAISERYLWNMNQRQSVTRFSVFRWGNVVGSRGSVIPAFIKSLKGGTVQITDKRMSRFWIPAEEAAAFMLSRYRSAPSDRAEIPPMKAAAVLRVVESLSRLTGMKDYTTKVIGIRPGEKIHECILSSHENCVRSDNCPQYSDSELDALLSSYLEKVDA